MEWIHHNKPWLGVPINHAHPLADGLVGLWLMNEGSGNIVQDLSGNGNDGIFTGDVSWTAGKHGPALDFPGSDDYVGFGDREYFDIAAPFSVSCYFRITDNAANRAVVAIKTNDSLSWNILYVNNAAYFDVTVGYNNASSVDCTYPAGVARLGEWVQLTYTYNGQGLGAGTTGNTVNQKIYINSIPRTLLDGANLAVSGNENRIGDNSTATYPFLGQIGYVIIWDRELFASEAAQLSRTPFAMFDYGSVGLESVTVSGVTIPIFIHHYKQAAGL